MLFLLQKNIKNVSKIYNFETKNLDIYKVNSNTFNDLGCPQNVIHLAWSGLPNYFSNRHLEIELEAQYSFLKNFIKSGLKNLTISGSCLEYGMINGCLNEKMNCNPKISYGMAKYKLFQKLIKLKSKYKYNLKWCRIFYMFGYGQHDKSLWSQLVKDVQNKKKYFRMSGGEQVRDYLHVKEVANYIVNISMIQKDIGVVNICSGNQSQ